MSFMQPGAFKLKALYTIKYKFHKTVLNENNNSLLHVYTRGDANSAKPFTFIRTSIRRVYYSAQQHLTLIIITIKYNTNVPEFCVMSILRAVYNIRNLKKMCRSQSELANRFTSYSNINHNN